MSWFRNTITNLYNAVSAPVAATRDALAERLQSVCDTASLLYNRMMNNIGYGQETLKDIVENTAEEEHQEEEQENNADLTPKEHEPALKGAFKSFRSPGLPKADVDTYIERITPHIKKLVEEQVGELGSAKVQLSMWVKWKKQEEIAIQLDPEEIQKLGISEGQAPGVYDIIVEKVFNNKMTEVFQGSNIEELLQNMFAYIKTQIENPKLPKSGFTLDSITQLDIGFHKLTLTRGSSYIKVPAWIASKKAVINPQNPDEECFKWAVIASLHHKEIDSHPERITKLQRYEDQYNWQCLEFPVAINKIDKFEKNNEDIAVNVLYIYSGQKRGTSKDEDEEERTEEKDGKITILRRSDYNTTRSKIVSLLLITSGEKKHYTAVKNLSRLLSRENANSRRAYHYCLNCLNGFRTESSRDKHYANCVDHDAVKIEMPWKEEDKWVQYHDGQNQFKVPFAMYANFENILKPMDERYKDRMNQLKAKRTGGSYTECINGHTPSGWCVYSKFAYGEIQDPLKAYR